MSQRTIKVVRHRIALKDRPRRGLEERIYLRLRSVVTAVARVLWRRPPRSRARRAFILRGTQLGFAALNRGDFESSFLLYHPDVEFITPPRLAGLGFDPVFRGRAGRILFQERWTAEWGEMRFEPDEVLDLGDRLLFLGGVRGAGLSSGAGFDSDNWAALFTVSAGAIVREEPFFDRREALAAAGLAE